MEQHFVTFYSPGTFAAEATTKPVDAWAVPLALEMMADIKERHGATPYGFRFSTRCRADDELDSKVIATGPMHYVNVKVETLAEIEARNDPKEEILRSNMRRNGYDRVATTTTGWKWTQPLREDDVIVEAAS